MTRHYNSFKCFFIRCGQTQKKRCKAAQLSRRILPVPLKKTQPTAVPLTPFGCSFSPMASQVFGQDEQMSSTMHDIELFERQLQQKTLREELKHKV